MPEYASPDDIQRVVLTALPQPYWGDRMQAFFGADPRFYLPDVQQIQQFLYYSLNTPASGLGAGFDCDDYAYAAKGLISLWNRDRTRIPASWCVGVIFGRFAWMPGVEHAANWFIDKSGALVLFEPQTHQCYPATSCQGDIKLILL